MSTIKSDNSNLILNADGAGSEVKFHNNGVEICKVDATGFSGNGIPTELNDLSDVTVSASDPTVSSNKPIGHLWINKTSGEQFVATDATTGANVWTNAGEGTGNVVPSTAIEYLIIAGGGAGGCDRGGGGGAGGMLTGTYFGLPATTYNFLVGAGGTGTTNGYDDGNPTTGFNSSLTAIAGGGGGNLYGQVHPNGGNGGSGGGGGSGVGRTGGTGTSGQGNDGGDGAPSGSLGGGGGGSGSAGVNANNGIAAGPGGASSNSSISGSAIAYAGGGGGAAGGNYPPGIGGGGGAGAGSTGDISYDGYDATANLGSGGGGATGGGAAAGGNGGSGVIYIRMATTSYSGTSTGSPTVTTDGLHTILRYTGSGSYTTL